jgi:hypothetical protein
LGGDSLLASGILARVERAFGVEFQASALLPRGHRRDAAPAVG